MATSTIKKITGLETIKSLNSNDDLDDLRTRGVYYVGSGIQNAPASYGMLVVTVNGDFVSQVMYSNSMYYRIRIGSPAAWTEWKRMTQYWATKTLTETGTVYLNLNTGSFVIFTSDRGGLWVKSGYNRSVIELVSSAQFTVTGENATKIKLAYTNNVPTKIMAWADLGCWFSES